ncbi:hypothetical protein OG943_17505 [Amycolatopsis sp. NBC_00345]|uniref:hypothetical protein n=1 Tax=Amycolatopsis sp. NBC_00345 TaxID=2975955 RepID=UPI002E26250D
MTGESEIVTVYGHTPWAGWPWLLGGAGILAFVLVLGLIRRKTRRSRTLRIIGEWGAR